MGPEGEFEGLVGAIALGQERQHLSELVNGLRQVASRLLEFGQMDARLRLGVRVSGLAVEIGAARQPCDRFLGSLAVALDETEARPNARAALPIAETLANLGARQACLARLIQHLLSIVQQGQLQGRVRLQEIVARLFSEAEAAIDKVAAIRKGAAVPA